MKKIKVLRIIARLNIGGPAIHTVLLTQGLDKSRFNSVLVCGKISKAEGDMSYYAKDRNVKPYFIPEFGRELNLLNDLKTLLNLYGLIKQEAPDIIHTHTAKAGALGRLAAILYGFLHPFNKRIKLIHTFHGHVLTGYFNPLKASIFILIERFLALFNCKVITVSESVKNELVRLKICQPKKIVVIPLGFELDKLLSISFRNDDNLNIGIVGRLVPVKNHFLFLEAAKEFINLQPSKVKFKIIGDGEMRQEIEDYANRLGISKYVDFLGWQKDLASIYSNLDIVTLTSINEGTPVSLIEAMAAQKPIVATDVGGIRDLLGKEIDPDVKKAGRVLERGILVQSGDAMSFANALKLLVDNVDLREKMALKARKFVQSKFTKERLIKDIEDLYLDVCMN